MMKQAEVEKIRARAARILEKAHIVITPQEREAMEVVDFGLKDIENIGLEIVVRE